MPFNIEFDSPAPMEASFQLGQGGGGAVSSVNGQIGDVVLDAGNIAYSDSTTYPSGSVGAEVGDLKSAISGGGLTPAIKTALLQLAEKVAYIDDQGQDYYQDLYDALYPPAGLVSISAVYTQSGTVYDTDSLDSLKNDLVVTAHYDDSSTEVVTAYTLSGTLAEGTSTITVTFGGKTTTFTVTVTHFEPITETISWTGSGSDKTSSVIDATGHDVYINIPYISGATQLASGVTSESSAVKGRANLYSDAECTQSAGYYFIDTAQISTEGRTGTQRPEFIFDTKYKVAPAGYYVKLFFTNNVSAFTSNGACGTYLNNNANTVTLE